MAETSIGWTATPGHDGVLHPGFTFNPWIGCSEDRETPEEMSEECAECYARGGTNHRVSKGKGLPLWGSTAHRLVTRPDYWKQPLRWNALAQQLGVRLKVFCASQADVFEDFDGPLTGPACCWADLDDVREALWPLVVVCDSLDWLFLTKRPQNVPRMVPAAWLRSWPRNVWLGTTAGTKRGAARRIPHLLRVSGGVPVFFVSYEPALEAVNFRPFLPHAFNREPHCPWCEVCVPDAPGGPDFWKQTTEQNHGPFVDWLIIGGESGRRARPFDLAWARSTVEACRAAGTGVFVKQLGAQPRELGGKPVSLTVPWAQRHPKGEDPAEWPEDLRVQEWPEVRR